MNSNQRKSRIYLDCTFTYQSGLNTGIQRVVRNIIKRGSLLNEEDIEWTPVVSVFGRYFAISADEVLKKKGITPSFGRQIKNLFELLKIHSLKITRKNQIFYSLTTFVFNKIEWILKSVYRALKYLRSCITVFRVGPTPIKIQAEDHFVLLDAFWTYNIEESLNKSSNGKPKVTAVIYDLIPITHPQFVDDGTVRLFVSSLPRLLRVANHFMCISESVMKEVIDYCKKNSPKTDFQYDSFPLGSDFNAESTLNDNPIRPEISAIFSEGQVWLTVGTIEPRKNHQFILDAFEVLWSQQSTKKLLIVGRVGWKNEEILERILTHPELNKRLFFRSDTSDSELKFCYKKSEGLIFASFTEGFGLPIVEAMACGLRVLCSDIPVFREVGGTYPTYFSLEEPDSLALSLVSREVPTSLPQTGHLLNWDECTANFFAKLLRGNFY